jgi:aromatic-L-amino-acid decarboxylase
MTEREPSFLDMDPEIMRRLGYAAVDRVVDHLVNLERGPAWGMMTRAEGEALLREPVPEEGAPIETLLDTAERDVLPKSARVGHPRFLAYVPGAVTFPGVLADVLTAGHNPFVGSWLGGSGPSMMELTVVDWIREMTGLPAGAGGLLTSGGSAANLIALVAARHARLEDRTEGATIYASDQTHTAITRAAWIAGFPRDAVRLLPADPEYRLDAQALRAAIAGDRAHGRRPFLIAANAGATSTGSVDPLPELAKIARDEHLWLHVDAAYGGFAAITERGRQALQGLDEADSWAFDPHKWLYQGFECGSVLLRRPEELRAAFSLSAAYLQDIHLGDDRPNLSEYGLQLSRSWRAFRIWLSVKHFGLARFRAAVDRTLDLALHAQEAIEGDPGMELLSPARLGVVCFRLVPPSGPGARPSEADLEALNRAALERLNASGYGFISSTRLGGTFALRFCILSHRTTVADVDGVLARLRELGETTG